MLESGWNVINHAPTAYALPVYGWLLRGLAPLAYGHHSVVFLSALFILLV